MTQQLLPKSPEKTKQAVHGYRGDEQYNTIEVIPAHESIQDPMTLWSALNEHPNVSEWGYQVAAGPAGPGQVVIFRDPEWGDDEPPDDPAESFCGLVIWDLKSKRVIQRIAFAGEVDDGKQ